MQRRFALAVLWSLTMCSGCWSSVIDEATASHVDPGGKVSAALTGGQMRTTAAVARAKSEPMTIEGASTELTFSLTAADSLGGTAISDLKNAGDSSQLNIRPGGRNQLQIHLDGGGCVATQGIVHLSLDAEKNLAGDFDADGTISDNTNSCHMSGTLANVPADR
jgi:hypothetical protein